jgi:hypothetical protein
MEGFGPGERPRPSRTLIRIVVTGAIAKGAGRWDVGHRIRDVEVGATEIPRAITWGGRVPAGRAGTTRARIQERSVQNSGAAHVRTSRGLA